MVEYTKYKNHVIILILSLVIVADTSLSLFFLMINLYPCFLTYTKLTNGEDLKEISIYWIIFFILKLFETIINPLFLLLSIQNNILLVVWNISKCIFFSFLLKKSFINSIWAYLDKRLSKYNIYSKFEIIEEFIHKGIRKLKTENKIISQIN